jgi:predicted LPLAT superfamily acyltransferase
VRRDAAEIKARHDAQVKAAVRSGRAALIVLGGWHDLSESVRALAPGWEYLRVTTARYRQVAQGP